MFKNYEIALLLVLLFLTFFLTKLLITNPNVLFVGFILSIIVLFISFFSPPAGLAFLIFSMLLSPEIKLADLPKREVVVRIDDLLIIAVFLGWFSKSIFTKKLEIFITEFLLPIFLYTMACIISTYLGVLSGTVIFKKAFFYILKYVEYFIIYFLTTQIVKDKKQIKIYIFFLILTSIIVNIHGYTLIGKVPRIYAPFDEPSAVIGSKEVGAGEANTYAGYLLIIFALLISLWSYTEKLSLNLLYISLIIFSLIPFAYTKSRSGYFAFLPMLFTIILLTEKKKMILLGSSLLLFAVFPILFPEAKQTIIERIQETFTGPNIEEETILGVIKVKEASALARVKSWQRVITEFLPQRPFLGFGVTGVGLVDAQIPLIIGEVGLIGLSIFLWLIISIFKTSYQVLKTTSETIYKSISLCVISSLVALLVQSYGANTFIIIRIMEPFWFLCGLVAVIKNLDTENKY